MTSPSPKTPFDSLQSLLTIRKHESSPSPNNINRFSQSGLQLSSQNSIFEQNRHSDPYILNDMNKILTKIQVSQLISQITKLDSDRKKNGPRQLKSSVSKNNLFDINEKKLKQQQKKSIAQISDKKGQGDLNSNRSHKQSNQAKVKIQLNQIDKQKSSNNLLQQKLNLNIDVQKFSRRESVKVYKYQDMGKGILKKPPTKIKKKGQNSDEEDDESQDSWETIENQNQQQKKNKTNQLDKIPAYKEDERAIVIHHGNKIIHHSILKDFAEDLNIDVLVNRVTANQVVIESQETQPQQFKNEQEIEKFLSKHSKSYKSIFSLQLLAVGGESMVCKIETKELEELVVKIPMLSSKLHQGNRESENLNYFQNSLYEHQMMKARGHSNFIPSIKEEVIEYNRQKGIIVRYVVIIERAQNDLHKLFRIWRSSEESFNKREFYSTEKLAFYCFQAMKLVNYLHSRNIYHGDIKPSNFLIFRNQLCKMGDFGISMKIKHSFIEKKDQPNYYKAKGLSEKYALQYIIDDNFVNKQQLYQNDRFALFMTFCLNYESMKRQNPNNYSQLMEEIIKDLDINNKEIKTLNEIVIKYTRYFAQNNEFALKLCNQFKSENKLSAIREVLLNTNYKFVIEGLINLAQQQRFQESLFWSKKKSTLTINKQELVLDSGEQYDPLDYQENEFAEFSIQKQDYNRQNSQLFTKFSNIQSWDYDEDKQNLRIEDPVWKQMAILLLYSCDERADHQLKSQIKKRSQESFKVGNIRLDVALEFLQSKKEDSFYDKNYSDEDLRFFYDYIKANNPKPKLILHLETIFSNLKKYDILVEINAIQTQMLLQTQKYELAEAKAKNCIQLSQNFSKREDLELDCLLTIAFCKAIKNKMQMSQRMIDQSYNMIISKFGNQSKQYLQLLQIKSLIAQSQGNLQNALQLEEERLVLSRNLYGDPANETISCYLSTGYLHMKLGNQDKCIDYIEKYAKFQDLKLAYYIHLIEAFYYFQNHQKLRDLINQIQQNGYTNDLVYLKFLSCNFNLKQYKLVRYDQEKKNKVMNALIDSKDRGQYIIESTKYKSLFLGALNFCKKYQIKFQDSEINILQTNQVIEKVQNDILIDKKEKVKALEQIMEKWTKIVENKIKSPVVRRRSTLRRVSLLRQQFQQ
ncbi:serine threonine protein kinase [Stylonychia lemnae]|uniref:Serine threonine protein kinase n=1 Tax=Stylonychia lemnae TaxID=5949 RepID=A0A078AUD4_STYLE|nr:serine threonine protein kinase [Stylonychia lemnae]|eukprot:CDW85616.1 serine threonine protein kinase [Stylonychia lemnae]